MNRNCCFWRFARSIAGAESAAVCCDQFLDRARADGAARVHLEVRDGNPAIEMYRGAGFAPVGRRRNYYRGADGAQFDAFTFSLEL